MVLDTGGAINLGGTVPAVRVGFSQFDYVAVWRQRFVTLMPEVTLLDWFYKESVHRQTDEMLGAI